MWIAYNMILKDLIFPCSIKSHEKRSKQSFLEPNYVRFANRSRRKWTGSRVRASLVRDWTTHFAQSVLPAATERIGSHSEVSLARSGALAVILNKGMVWAHCLHGDAVYQTYIIHRLCHAFKGYVNRACQKKPFAPVCAFGEAHQPWSDCSFTHLK